MKVAENDSTEEKLLAQVKSLLNDRTTLKKAVKQLETDLKEMTESRIETLTNEEIDMLMYEKWFGSVIPTVNRLFENSLIKDLETLEQLQNRYSETLTTLEEESDKLEKELESMMEQLVVKE